MQISVTKMTQMCDCNKCYVFLFLRCFIKSVAQKRTGYRRCLDKNFFSFIFYCGRCIVSNESASCFYYQEILYNSWIRRLQFFFIQSKKKLVISYPDEVHVKSQTYFCLQTQKNPKAYLYTPLTKSDSMHCNFNTEGTGGISLLNIYAVTSNW